MATIKRKKGILMRVFVLAIVCVLWTTQLWASGADGYEANSFAPEHYVMPGEIAAYAQGNLGVVPGSYWRVYHFLAYRSLTGHPLAKSEIDLLQVDGWKVGPLQGQWESVHDEKLNGVGSWFAARKSIRGVADVKARVEGTVGYVSFLNCPIDAFERATQTLAERLQRGGQSWAAVWLAGQDAVFANCSFQGPTAQRKTEADMVLPAALPANAPAWLMRDREYQTAAALFYAGRYDQARSRFQAIAKDSQSSWQPLAAYLAARSLLRKATLQEPLPNQPKAQADLARKTALQTVRNELLPLGKTFRPALSLLGWVDARLRPNERAVELAAVLATSKVKDDAPRLLSDYLLLLDKMTRTEMIGSVDPMTAWIGAMQAQVEDDSDSAKQLEGPRKQAMALARKRWNEKRDIQWLLPLLGNARAGEVSESEMRAASAVPSNAPAFQTLQYHLARIAIIEKRANQADVIVSTNLQKHGETMSIPTRNRWLGLKLLSAKTLDEFLKAGLREPADKAPGEPIPNEGSVKATHYDEDFDQHLYSHLALKELKAVRLSLPEAARKSLTEEIWTRAVVFGDYATADEFANELAKGRDTTRHLYARFKNAKDAKAKHLAAMLILVNTPEFDPAVMGPKGQRIVWGCGANEVPKAEGDGLAMAWPNFMSEEARAQAQKEQQQLRALPVRSSYFAPTLIEWAKQKPADPEAPKALHFLVASTREECYAIERPGQAKPQYSRQAFQLLRKLYPKSEWAAKTRHYY